MLLLSLLSRHHYHHQVIAITFDLSFCHNIFSSLINILQITYFIAQCMKSYISYKIRTIISNTFYCYLVKFKQQLSWSIKWIDFQYCYLVFYDKNLVISLYRSIWNIYGYFSILFLKLSFLNYQYKVTNLNLSFILLYVIWLL